MKKMAVTVRKMEMMTMTIVILMNLMMVKILRKKRSKLKLRIQKMPMKLQGMSNHNSGLNSEDSEKYNKLLKLGIKWNEIVEDYLS